MTSATLRVLITGSRDWPCHAVAEQVIAPPLTPASPRRWTGVAPACLNRIAVVEYLIKRDQDLTTE